MSDQFSTSNMTIPGDRAAAPHRISIMQGIGRTLLISFLTLAMLPLIMVGIISGLQSRASLAETAQARLVALADLREQTVRDWLNERQQDLLSLRNDSQTEYWIHSVLSAPDTSSLKTPLTTRLQQEVLQGGGFKRLFLIDTRGLSVVSTDPALLNTGHVNQPYTTRQDAVPFSTLYRDTQRGGREVAVAQGIFDTNNRLIGMLVGTTDLSRLSDIMRPGTRIGEMDDSYLVDDDYHFLTAPRSPTANNTSTTDGVEAALKNPTDKIQGVYRNYAETEVYGVYHVVPELGRAVLATEQATSEVLAPVNNQLRGILLAMGLSVLTAAGGAYFIARRITRPIDNLTAVAERVAAGDLNQVAAIEYRDQIGTLAASFNAMTGRLRDLIDSLETRVEMRTAQVQASADVGRAVTSILDPQQLLRQVVQLITERFGFYYAAAFTLDPAGEWAVLQEAAGPENAAWLLKQAGHRLELNGNSMVASCLRNRHARIALDVGAEAVRFANPLLPDTHSEVALPLIVGDQLLGALDVQSTQTAAFDETSTAVLQNMADQIAVALNNAGQYRQERTRAQQTTYLLEATVELTSQNDTSGLYQRIIELTEALLSADSAALWLPLDENELELRTASGSLQALIGQRLIVGEGVAGRVYATGLALRLDNVRVWKDATLDFNEVAVRAVLASPMIWQGQPIGVLMAAHTLPDKVFTPDDANSFQLFAAQTASAIENVRLLERLQQTLEDLGSANKRLTGAAWQKRLRDQEISYQHLRPTSSDPAPTTLSLALPIELRGQSIGQVIVEDDQPQRQLNAEERELVQEVAQRMALALESARLFEQTQSALGEARRLAQRERLINRITAQLRGAVSVEEVLRIAADEMRHSVQATYTAVNLTPPTGGDGKQ
ncbi:Methyl-accepting chemotaxis protein McpB [Thermoflexales bacterium]|nr:Methyl-accepting chemotaxis protein McpB [Thermoflexales bacterium]